MAAFSTPETEALFPVGPTAGGAEGGGHEVQTLRLPSPANEGMSFLKSPMCGAGRAARLLPLLYRERESVQSTVTINFKDLGYGLRLIRSSWCRPLITLT